MTKARLGFALSFFSLVFIPTLTAQTAARLTVDTATKTADVSPTLYGLMTEEINYSYDGGLYAEMIRNRGFNNGDWQRLAHWSVLTHGNSVAEMTADKDNGPSKALPYSLNVKVSAASDGNEAGIANDGYWGMAVHASTAYTGSFYAKVSGVGDAHVRLVANDTGMTVAEAKVPMQDGDWKQYTYTMKSSAMVRDGSANHFEITFSHPGSVCGRRMGIRSRSSCTISRSAMKISSIKRRPMTSATQHLKRRFARSIRSTSSSPLRV